MTAGPPPGPATPPERRGLVLLSVQRDAAAAGDRRDDLLAAGVDAELHIVDAAAFGPSSSVYPAGAPFAFALFVPAPQRDRAAEALIGADRDGGRSHPGGRAPLGAGGLALALLALAAALLAAALLRGG